MKNPKAWLKWMWVGLATLFGGLLVGLIGIVAEQREISWGLPVLLTGVGIFLLGDAVLCVSCTVFKKRNQKWQQEQDAALGENQILLNLTIPGSFTENTLVYQDDGREQHLEIASLTCYRVREFSSPHKSGVDKAYLTVNSPWNARNRKVFLINERSVSVAERYGVKVVNRMQPDHTGRQKIKHAVNRGKNAATRVIGTILLVVLLLAAVIGLSIAFKYMGLPSSIITGMIGVAVPFASSSGILWFVFKKQSVTVYEDGLYIFYRGQYNNVGKCFLPIEYIEHISYESEQIVLDTGYCLYMVHDNGAYEYIKEHYPDKCAE